MKTAYATIKGFEVMRMFKKGQFTPWIDAIAGGTEAASSTALLQARRWAHAGLPVRSRQCAADTGVDVVDVEGVGHAFGQADRRSSDFGRRKPPKCGQWRNVNRYPKPLCDAWPALRLAPPQAEQNKQGLCICCKAPGAPRAQVAGRYQSQARAVAGSCSLQSHS